MLRLLRNLLKKSGGQDLLEYACLTGFISLGGVSAITMVGSSVNDAFGNIAQVLPAGEADDGDDGDDND